MKSVPKPSYSGELPIHQRREEILQTLQSNQIVVIAGETGSGKTTQIPKFLLECGFGSKGWIGCTQPRRVAALSVAQRIAEELNVRYGHEVGAKIRFTDETRKDSLIKVMTDGILLNELQDDPMLTNYEAIVIDEAHERSLNIDFILGCLRNLAEKRKDLKIIITSATIDTERFSEAFNNAPVIEVSGRMYPVDTLYRPVEDLAQGNKDYDYIDAAAEVIDEILSDNSEGDILVFLPGERDIRELRKALEDSPARLCDLLPLYGRLAKGDQQRIFHPGGRRRVILSTNIAETSLTVPGIRYVVDTGLARISRYSPHSRTQRLPIEPIAQSSAEQRKGRCGRVSDGTCYRLYSAEDYGAREAFNTPEIHRSNLASVILRMMAFKLGDIRTFPFIEPPGESAIVGGYRLLSELGAVTRDEKSPNEDDYRLTKLGRRLSRLPVDPTVGRMLLQAQEEGALDEVLVIASGLSIQDPRERPAEVAKEADEIHKQFVHPESDFLTLLNIWNSYHEKLDALSHSKLRKFCRAHFLSYQRMREWRDTHHQIERMLDERRTSKNKRRTTNAVENSQTCMDAQYAAIHRSILAGLLSNIAYKEEEHNYRGPRNRKALLFPGSGLFDHKTAKKQRKAAYAKKTRPKPAKTTAPKWIVCGEWMETNRLYARNAARIEVDWIGAMAGDLLSVRHTEPYWSTKSAAVLCKQRKLLFGLEISRSNVSYCRIAPDEATDIFTRNGLVEGGIQERPAFFTHNEALRETAASEIARQQLGSTQLIEDQLFEFYRTRLSGVGSYSDLRRFAKAEHGGSLDFLKAQLRDLLPRNSEVAEEDFPRTIQLGGHLMPLSYRNEPGHEADGVTLRIPVSQLDAIQEGVLDWAIPGHLEAKIENLLRNLPKPLRIKLHPLKERVKELREKIRPSDTALSEQLTDLLKRDYGIQTYRDQWTSEMPEHLKLRIQVENREGEPLAESRDLETLRKKLDRKSKSVRSNDGLESIPAWQRAAEKFERENLNEWNFGDLPERIDLSGESGLPLAAYPALVLESGKVHLRLLTERAASVKATREAWPDLCELVLGRELAWIRRDLKELKGLGVGLLPLGGYEAIKDSSWQHLRRHLFACDSLLPLKESAFKKTLERADREKRGIVQKLNEQLAAVLEARADVALILEKKKTKQAISYPGMRTQLQRIAPADVLDQFEFSDLPHITRFLKGMIIRAQRARESIQRDMEKAKRVAPFEAKFESLSKLASQYKEPEAVKGYMILLEEFKISVFAQELGTAQKTSEKRLDDLASQIEALLR
ncbi:ATP-dependent RNA helicase HrpA [Coraliomargarita sinensis]|uniref:ATP-dependent RNA helicase HrpA n=1 Tax=Coraliomargarita sinensis TaxID=2174842 RepID=UPI001304E6E0|nr:ATP-dependent RNA helicase HrpA [Coraliomargarita sinensis]